MPPAHLQGDDDGPGKRTLLQVVAPPEDAREDGRAGRGLMGRKPELRFQFIQDNAAKLDVEEVDV